MKKPTILVILILIAMIISACGNVPTPLPTLVSSATPYPTYTPQPTYTPYPTYTYIPSPTSTPLIIYRTPTPKSYSGNLSCTPITNMDYSNNSRVAILLQAYVSSLSDVKSVSYTIPERLYKNTLSEIIFVNYIGTDGKLYAKRYIVYMEEFGWLNGVFSIDGQCWIDPPH